MSSPPSSPLLSSATKDILEEVGKNDQACYSNEIETLEREIGDRVVERWTSVVPGERRGHGRLDGEGVVTREVGEPRYGHPDPTAMEWPSGVTPPPRIRPQQAVDLATTTMACGGSGSP
ncbi:hypothetical protein E2562_017719 [Oryza meyeriana var. granulata]|uniref:Uncharacterized protein n=1 Tax=Oryza meyeriana var. granulata TaxID=110450 RepID=A0A6G1BXX1_9ORYZ|nr:hypothetical protein E2562_017719 [Oryza meyeriana var. granulata]